MANPARELLVTPAAAEDARRIATGDLNRLLRQYDPSQREGPDRAVLLRLGEGLFPLAFPAPGASDALLAALRAGGPLRLAIVTADPALARLPWEFLCLPEAVLAASGCTAETLGWPPEAPLFLALHPQVSAVRRGGGERRAQLTGDGGPLRLLIAWANPACGDWPPIATIAAEIDGIQSGLRGLTGSHLAIKVLEETTRDSLAHQLQRFRPHLIHFLVHGAYPELDDPGEVAAPSLVLHGPTGYDYLSAADLAGLCQGHGVHAVVLNSCWSGHGSQSLAATLSAAGVPLVVAMQLPVLQSAALGLALFWYGSGVAMGRPLEDSLADYRRACARGWAAEVGTPDWGVPVLHLGVEDSRLFRTTTVDPYPIDFRPLLWRHVPIVGRGFLFERIANWRRAAPSGVFLLTAEPGLGKTAFAAQWIEKHPPGAHYFFVQREGRNDPHECLRSLYIALLGRYGELDAEARGLSLVALREQLAAFLTQTVAKRCAEQDRDEVLLIDALDECRPARQGEPSLVELLPLELPPRVYLLLTSRPGPLAEDLRHRGGIVHCHLDGTAADNLKDAAEFCRLRLTEHLPHAVQPDISAAASRLAARAGGNFLVLQHFLNTKDLAEAGDLAAIEARPLSPQVMDIYAGFLSRVTHPYRDDLTAREALSSVLGAFASAAAPVTREQVCAAFGVSAARWAWALGHLGQFLSRGAVRESPAGADAYGLYHETFREFLLGERGELTPDLPGLHACWAAYAQTWPKLQGYARRYALRHLPFHQRQAGQGAAVAETLLDYGYLAAALGADEDPAGDPPRSPFELVADFETARALVPAEAREVVRLVSGALSLCAHVLTAAPDELAGQLLGRLTGIDDPGVRQTLARASNPRHWLRPVIPTLTAPGGPLLRVLEGHTARVKHVALTGDGRAVSASEDGTLRVWDLNRGNCLRVLEGHTEAVWHVAVTGDGRAAVSASRDETMRVWDLATGACLRVLEGHTAGITHVALTADGRAVSTSWDRSLRLWDLASGACLARFTGDAPMTCCAVSTDSHTLVAGDEGGAVHILRIENFDA